jgi:serine/threonine protein kinase
MVIETGRTLNERYRLIRPIGHGSQASVWVAEHLALTTTVAVKLIDPELAKRETARERFRQEATAAAQLRSAHVVQILDHGIDGEQPFIVMELLDGEDLFERLAHRGRIPLRETSKVVTQVARALSRAHQAGIVHRDLKPENVFLVSNEDDEIVKVLDFGVAKVTTPDKTTMQRTGVGTLIGTPHYMSPEQVKGISEVDYRTDLWALGVIAYQCVTGELPFDSEGVGDLLIRITLGEAPVPSKTLPSLPASFDAWFARACERDPAKRFQSARELALALAGVVSAIPEVPRATTVRPPGGSSSTAPSKLASTRPAPPVAGAPPVHVPPAPKAMRPMLMDDEGMDPGDLEGSFEPPPVGREMFDSTDIDFDDEPELNSRFSHVEFPLLVRAGTSHQKPAATTPSSPPAESGAPPAMQAIPPPPPTAPPAPETAAPVDPQSSATAAPAPSVAEGAPAPSVAEGAPPVPALGEPAPPSAAVETPSSAPGALLPPPQALPSPTAEPAEALSPPTDAVPLPPAPAAVEAESRLSSPKVPASARGSTVSGLARPGSIPTDPPPELDGSRRRRMVRFLVAALVLGAVGVAWTVVRSQFRAAPAAAPTEIVPTTEPPPPPTPSVEPPLLAPTTTATAVDPGKVSRPTRPAPSTKGRPKKGPKKAPTGEIVIPDGPDDAVPPAP